LPHAVLQRQGGEAMFSWPRYPKIYEISTWVWLSDLSKKAERSIDLRCVPPTEWDAIAKFGFDAVWLMGVWERSPVGIAIANRNEKLVEDFRRALSDFKAQDNVGSPYCVRRYVVDGKLGGPEGLAVARKELAQRGVRLILDFVPNHVAPDHPWASEHPECFIQGSADDIGRDPGSYINIHGKIYACGRDPYFPAWPDVLQLNAFQPRLRRAVIETLSTIAEQCDGVRCDMAMLFLNAIFARTWGARAGSPPPTEYWVDVITATKKAHPNFLFAAEAYWDLEWELQQKGFDFCYDKKLYDRLIHDAAESVRLHLCADPAYQEKLLRFIENHDEPRAAAVFSPAKERVAALTMATVPGARLFHEGQFEGRKIRVPVFLGRRPTEPVDTELQTFYRKLLAVIGDAIFQDGRWSLNKCSGWPDNTSFQNLVSWSWMKDGGFVLIVVNLSDRPAQARVQMPWPELQKSAWRLTDELSGVIYDRDGDEMHGEGLFVALEPFGFNCFRCRRLEKTQRLAAAAAP
jgi:glycosidase